MSKWIISLTISAVLSGCSSVSARPPSDGPSAGAAEIKRLEENWVTAFNSRDSRFMAQTLAPEYVLVSSGGAQGTTITHRDGWMKVWLGEAPTPYEAKVLDVVVAGDTAVATLEARWRRESLLTDTWARRNGRWQLMFRHSAPRR